MNELHIDPKLVQTLGVSLLVLLIFSSRMGKGKAKQTPQGLSFGIKPFFSLVRALLLAVYAVLVGYLMATHPENVRWWVPVLLLIVVAMAALRLPGTIVLGPKSIVQHFWLLKDKEIPYRDVMAVQIAQAGRATRVMGSNRVTILHTANHSASDEFRNEMRNRTGKKPVL